MNVYRIYKFIFYLIYIEFLVKPILALIERMFVALYNVYRILSILIYGFSPVIIFSFNFPRNHLFENIDPRASPGPNSIQKDHIVFE